MALDVKICGLNEVETLDVAVAEGAALLGFNFYPPSPRAVSPVAAASLARRVPEGVIRVGLFVDPTDDQLAEVLRQVPLDLIQLHGSESPGRLAAVKARFGKPLMKVIKIASAEDFAPVESFLPVADRLMFDSKAPASMKGALPGGNALAFDWTLLSGRRWGRPWMLAGALNVSNLAEAVALSGTRAVDLASGVEERPGKKDPEKIRAFMRLARTL